jgi:hypothetical protein
MINDLIIYSIEPAGPYGAYVMFDWENGDIGASSVTLYYGPSAATYGDLESLPTTWLSYSVCTSCGNAASNMPANWAGGTLYAFLDIVGGADEGGSNVTSAAIPALYGTVTSIEFTTSVTSILFPDYTVDLDTPESGLFVVRIYNECNDEMPLEGVVFTLQNLTEGSAATDYGYLEVYEEINTTGFAIQFTDSTLLSGVTCSLDTYGWMYVCNGYYGGGSATSLVFQITAVSATSAGVSVATSVIILPEPEDRGVTAAYTYGEVNDETFEKFTIRRLGGWIGNKVVELYGYVIDARMTVVQDDSDYSTTDTESTLATTLDGESSTCTVTLTGYTPRIIAVNLSSISTPLAIDYDILIEVERINFMPWMKRKRPLKIRRK